MMKFFLSIGGNGRGYATCGKTWTRTYPPLRTLPARAELANCSKTRMAYEPLLGGRALFFS